uniref:Uncharacterized protein n=1 Tax=Trypanosoma vivax (strain Y486) TaxID=1055687 RepID=G0UBU5_TRYVY|nr:hypothetical protein TVY486_1107770 [Trypanosoma vivax Y486]
MILSLFTLKRENWRGSHIPFWSRRVTIIEVNKNQRRAQYDCSPTSHRLNQLLLGALSLPSLSLNILSSFARAFPVGLQEVPLAVSLSISHHSMHLQWFFPLV